uniref:Integrase catalytic domain-containing protein n=1 Tax=Tanacetum cinerariifolium TaxID=118510 RepID=A0A6L2NTA1_TANCI|nr:hypothetical protein [Tanacetum cinerariifolium]
MQFEQVRSRWGTKSTRNHNPNWLLRVKIKGKGKNKLAYAPKPKIPPPPKREDPAKDSIYYHCDNSIQVSRNNMVYFSAVQRDGIFEIDLSDSYTNVSSMYALSYKRAKSNLDSSLLWHCHLRHISKKRIEKLQHDRLLNSTDPRDFEKCVPCMSRKIARKPYTHQVERAKDLLGLIHTDEVENQLGKTIKLLRSDRKGEYISQEFLDHLKDHEIIAHHTPPYMPQHNGVSENRNRTLLDMVQSMMSQTTLPKSFWDYAFKTAARILNMVPTKKVEKALYETMALEHKSLSPRRNCQENVSHGDKTATTSNELDLLFSPMFDELLNGSSKVVSKSSAEDLDGDGERGFNCLTFALVLLKAHREGCRASHGGFPYWGGLRTREDGTLSSPPVEMAFRNFIYTEDDDDLVFLPKKPSPGFGSGSPSVSLNTKLPKDAKEPDVQPIEIIADLVKSPKAGVFIVHPGIVATRIKERKCKTRRGSSRPHVKRKIASGLSSSRVVLLSEDIDLFIRPSSSLYVLLGLPDCFELKDANACHLKISAITLPAWKGHLDNQIELELHDLHDRCYARQVMVDNAVNKRAPSMAEFDQNPVVLALREKIFLLTANIKEHKGNLDRMMLESQKWAGYQVTLSTLESKVDSLEAEKAKLEAVEASLRKEVEELKQDRRDVVLKVVPYATIELVYSDKLDMLVGTLVSSAITYGRCRAYEQVAAMKEPFDLSKAKGYRYSYKKEHTQASNDFSTATFLWLDYFVADFTASIEALLSKKPPTLQKHAPLRTQMPVPSS